MTDHRRTQRDETAALEGNPALIREESGTCSRCGGKAFRFPVADEDGGPWFHVNPGDCWRLVGPVRFVADA